MTMTLQDFSIWKIWIWTLLLIVGNSVFFSNLKANASPIPIDESVTDTKSDREKCLEEGTCTVVGDMIMMKQGEFTSLSGISRSAWPQGIVPYEIDSSIARDSKKAQIVKNGIKELNDKTCITLRPATNSDSAKISIGTFSSGCFSTVGYTGKKQQVNLGQGCFVSGIVAHEIIHALGYFHEQSRADRDSFIRINEKNIEKGYKPQFEKQTSGVDYYGVPYNYDSIMHYPKDAFSNPRGSVTIQTLNNNKGLGNPNNIGQRKGLSSGDIQMINNKYKKSSSKCGSR